MDIRIGSLKIIHLVFSLQGGILIDPSYVKYLLLMGKSSEGLNLILVPLRLLLCGRSFHSFFKSLFVPPMASTNTETFTKSRASF